MSAFPKSAIMEFHRRSGIWPSQAAGLRALYKPRGVKGFGKLVGVYDGEAAGMDTEPGRWSTVCEVHNHVIAHQTLAIAKSWASIPEEWCDGCMDRVATKVAEG